MALQYGPVDFTDCLTSIHVYGPAKDPSGSDQLYTVFEIGARAIFNAGLPPAMPNEPPATTVARLRHMLTLPRQSIYYDIDSPPGQQGNNPIINLPSGRDDANGPWPDEKAFSINYTTAGTFEVFWKCTIKLRDCGPTVPTSPLSLRYEDSLSWDKTWKAIYRRVGTLIISSNQKNNIDWFRRNKLAIPVSAGFQRTNAHYTCSRDGLSCNFAFQDEQIRFAPPGNCVDLNIVQSESMPMQGGKRQGALSITLQGIQNASVIDLSRYALRILYARMWAANPLRAEGIVPGTIVIETRENTSSVEVNAVCRYMVQPSQMREQTSQLVNNSINAWTVGAISGFTGSTTNSGSTGNNLIGNLPGNINVNGGVVAAQKSQSGKTPASTSYMPWIGAGTSKELGYSWFANPNGAVGGPADGVGLATSVSLFAALLNDPCGAQLDSNPKAQNTGAELRTTVSLYNTPSGGGQGGQGSTNVAQLTASLSAEGTVLGANTIAGIINDALTVWDGQPGVYDHWQCVNEYIGDPGVVVLPTSDPLGVNIAVAHSSPMLTLVKRWTAKRNGATPAVPAPVVLLPSGRIDNNWILVKDATPILRELGTVPDSVSVIYEASGYYVFQCLNPALANFIAEIPPTLDTTQLVGSANWLNDVAIQGNRLVSALFGVLSSPLGTNSLSVNVPN